jgi:group I intron endonuclease
MYGIIYKAANTLNGKVYIGQTTETLASRKSKHAYRAKKGDRRSVFQAALLDEGFKNFIWEQIDTADTQAELDAKEKQWIAYYDSMNPDKGYNNTDGGAKFHHTPETCRKIGKIQEGEKNHNFGKHPSPETRRKMSEAQRRKIISPETRRRMREAAKNRSPEYYLKGEKSHMSKITEAVARQIKLDIQAGMQNCDIAKKYSVAKDIVANIKYGKAWAWLQIGA